MACTKVVVRCLSGNLSLQNTNTKVLPFVCLPDILTTVWVSALVYVLETFIQRIKLTTTDVILISCEHSLAIRQYAQLCAGNIRGTSGMNGVLAFR